MHLRADYVASLRLRDIEGEPVLFQLLVDYVMYNNRFTWSFKLGRAIVITTLPFLTIVLPCYGKHFIYSGTHKVYTSYRGMTWSDEEPNA